MHNRVILYLLLCLWGIISPSVASHLLPTTALEEHQIHKPLNITGWIQEQEENRGLQEGEAEFLRLCHGSDRAKLNNKLKEYHLVNPEHEAIKLSSEYTPYSFWGKGINEEDFGILGGVLKDGKYLSAKYRINPNRSAGYGEEERYNPSSGSLSKAVYVNLYKEENRYEFVRKDNDSIVYSGRAKVCDLIAENEDGYFVTGEKENAFVDYARKNSIKTDTLLEQTSVLKELVEQVNEQLNKKVGEPKDESILGIVLSDKLQAYEEFNNRRFLVVPLKTRVLSINQRSWQELAQKVFSKSELDSTDGDILITIPYVACKGIAGDYSGHYYFMPGVATGEKVKVDFSQLQKKSYSNTIKISSFSASNEKLKLTDIGRFIMDIFTHTSKKMAIHYGLFNASGTIEYGRVYKEVTTGNNFNKQINLYVQKRYTELLEIQNDYDAKAKSMEKAAYSDERAAYRTDRRAAPSRDKRARILPSSLKTLEENRRKALEAKVLELSNSFDIVAYNNIPESDKILFKEAFMETVYDGNKENNARYYIQRIAFRTLQDNLRYYRPTSDDWISGKNYNTAHTFNKSFWTEYVDRYVYSILDITSYVLMFFGLDVLSEGGALFYSVLRGKVDRLVEYTVSMAAPSVLGPAFRTTFKATGNLFTTVRKEGVKTVETITTKAAAAKLLTKKRAKGVSSDNLSSLLKTDITGQFPQLRDATGKLRGAGTLWKRTGDDITEHFSSNGKYLVKHDKATHELVFADVETGEVLGYYLDEVKDFASGKFSQTISGNYDELITKLSKLHKGGTINTPSGYTLTSKPGKTTTILGSYDPDIKKVLSEIGNLKNADFGAKNGGFNVLNVPDNYNKTAKQFWDDYNVKFLDEAIARGDDIVLATDPMKLDKVFKDPSLLTDITDINSLSKELLKTDDKTLSGFGRELKYVFSKNYKYNAELNVFFK